MFRPHTFDTKYLRIDAIKPVIYIQKEALEEMYHFVNLCDKEIGWLGTVEREDDETFVIQEVFLLEQDVSHTHTKFDPDSIAKFYNEILQLENGNDLANQMKFWGHSHVNMDTFASGQDDLQMDEFRDNGNEWFIRGIFNKKGKISFTIYLYTEKLIIKDVEWCVLNEFDWNKEAAIKKEIETKVKTSYQHNTSHGHSSINQWCTECKVSTHDNKTCPLCKSFCMKCREWYNDKKPHSCPEDNPYPACNICKTNHHANYDCVKKELKNSVSKWCKKCDSFHTDNENCKEKPTKTGTDFCNMCHSWHSDKDHKCSDIVKSLTHRLVRKVQNESVPPHMMNEKQKEEQQNIDEYDYWRMNGYGI
jgi:hypothetical protein